MPVSHRGLARRGVQCSVSLCRGRRSLKDSEEKGSWEDSWKEEEEKGEKGERDICLLTIER